LTLGEQIVGYRKNHGYSQEELSHLSGISLRTIQRIEKGEVNPRGHTLKALAESLRIELYDLKTEDVSPDNQIATKIRTLNTLGLLVILLPLVSTLIQVIYWAKNKHLLSSHSAARKVLSFQILWIIMVLIFFSMVHILTYSITGQSAYGHFPVRTTGYAILLLANISIILHTAFKLNRNLPVLLSGVPSLI
jgi:transcriptional regulator with XRE-family HTH domain